METLGGRLQLHVSGEGGDTPCFPSQFGSPPSSLPSPSSGYPLTLTHTLVCSSQSRVIRCRGVAPDKTTSSKQLASVMTHCAAEAKPACVCAMTAVVRALRRRLKALRRLLLLAGTDGSRQRAAQTCDAGRWGTVLDCCGPAHTSTAVSIPECVCVSAQVTFRSLT